MPLSRYGLWEADTTAARSSSNRRTSSAAPGVGSTPPRSAWPPAAAIPAASAASSISPDSRVSRTIRTCGASDGVIAAAARPSDSASSAVRNSPATPRTPSVPKRRAGALTRLGSALGELRALASLLQAGLLALLGAGVAAEEAAPLELHPQARVRLDQRASNAVAERARLGRDATAVDLGHDVHALVEARRLERLARRLLERRAREVILQRAAVDHVGPAAGTQDHARDRGLALAGGLVAGVRREVQRRAGRRRLPRLLALGRLGLRGLGLGDRGSTLLAGRPVAIGVLVALALRAFLGEHEVGLEVGAGDHLVLLLLLAAPAALTVGTLGRGGLALRLGCGFGIALGFAFGLAPEFGFGCGFGLAPGFAFRGGLHIAGPALVRGVGIGRRLRRRLGVLHLLGIDVPGRALVRGVGLGRVGLGRVALFGSVRALVVDHRASTSMGCGCWAACGWSAPAYTLSLRNCWRPSRVRGSIPLTALRITSSGRRSSISSSVRERSPPG